MKTLIIKYNLYEIIVKGKTDIITVSSSKYSRIIFRSNTNYIESSSLDYIQFINELKTIFTSSSFNRQEIQIVVGDIITDLLKSNHFNNGYINTLNEYCYY